MKKCLIIYNPRSGKGRIRSKLDEVICIIKKYNYDVYVRSTKYKGHAIEIVKDSEYFDLVMSFGGDGTFNEVMRGNFLRKERLLLAHIPVGTTNDVGAMFGYGKDILTNVRSTMNGIVKEMDICMINNTPFIYVAGIGKYLDISYDTSSSLKNKYGYLAYISSGVREFFRKTKLYDITYKIDDNEYRGLFSLVLISSANHIAGVSNIYNDVKLDDDKFEVILCNISKKSDLFKSLMFLGRYGVKNVPGIYFYRTNNIKIKFNDVEKINWGIDGEKLECKSNVFEFKNKCGVKILLPKKNVKKLFVNS